jgi:bifunctional enzyme CysN/CysC
MATSDVSAPSMLRFITCGSVDDGKSTLLGRLLYDAGMLPDDQVEALKKDSRRQHPEGDVLDFSLLMDGLDAPAGHHHRCRLSLFSQ